MKPAPFLYRRASSINEALSLLADLGEDARPLAGGQSLVPLMNLRMSTPTALIDLGGVPGLSYIDGSQDVVRVGAMTRQRDLEVSELVAEQCPLLREASAFLGHFQIRNRGTVGGSIAHADPAAEYPAAMVALDGEVIVASLAGERRIPAAQFFLGPFTTALDPGELLTSVELPVWGHNVAFLELARRHGDFAIAGVAVALDLDGGQIQRAGIGLAGVGPTVIKATSAENLITGNEPSDELFGEAAARTTNEVDPGTDIHGTAAYRRALTQTLTFRALRAAAYPATDEGDGELD
jgi:CO/xanthine dehydrogenase FAD-binding subunit